MCLKSNIISLNDASCLKDKSVPLRIAVAQPKADLILTEELGPHYDPNNLDDAYKRIMEFIRIVKETDSELAIAPEYYLPIKVAKEILSNLDYLRKDTFYILPMETQTYENFNVFIKSIQENGTCIVKISSNDEGSDNELKKWVNAALIIYINNEKNRIFIQFKTKPASSEQYKIIKGKEIFGFEGEQGVLSIAICSDVNRTLDYIWKEIASRKSFNLTIHCQFNPKPDFEDYYQTFWSSLLNEVDGDKRMIFSINWAKGSNIICTNKNFVLNRPSNKFFRGKKLHKGHLYNEQSRIGLHLEHRFAPSNRKVCWEIWYGIVNSDNIRVIDFVRPKQDIAIPQQNRNISIVSSHFYECTNYTKYIEKEPEELSYIFINQLNLYNSNSAGDLLKNLTLCEIEAFCAACNLDKYEQWLEKDVDSRLPTAYLLCCDPSQECDLNNNGKPCKYKGKSCNVNRKYWEDEAMCVASCLDRIKKISDKKKLDLKPYINNLYPINCKDYTNDKYGWIFHGKGILISRYIGKKVNHILKNSKEKMKLNTIQIYRVDGEISCNDILDSPAEDISNPDLSFQHDIFKKHQLPFIEIINFNEKQRGASV
jgi:predicted amidohydrolase